MSAIRDNAALSRFELEVDGHVAFADYRREPGQLIIDHVEAPQALRGAGAAGRLMEGVVAEARRERRKITPLCSYAVHWLRNHPEHTDLVA